MKIVKIILIALVSLILIALIGLFIFIKTFDVNKYLPQITQSATKALGRDVAIGHAGLSLSLKGIGLDLQNVSVGDDPQFSKEQFAHVNAVHLGLELMPLITQRAINITDITVQSPEIHVIKNAQGVINAQTIAQSKNSPSEAPAPTAQAPQTSSSKGVSLPAITAQRIQIQDASLTYIDQNPSMPLNVTISNVNIAIDHFSLTQPFGVTVDAKALSDRINIHAKGQMAIDMANLMFKASALNITTDLSQLNMAYVRSVSSAFKSMPLPEEVKGTVTVDVQNLEASASGLKELNAQIAASNGQVRLKELLNPISQINAQITIDAHNAQLKSFSCHVGSGEVTANAVINDYLKTQNFTAEFKAQAIKAEELIDQSAMPAHLKGDISASAQFKGQGFTPDALKAALTGNGEAAITNGVLTNLNIASVILGKTLSVIPGLASQLDSMLDTVLKEKVGEDYTTLTKAEAKFSVAQGEVHISDGIVASKVFDLTAQGTVGFDMNTNIDILFRLTDVASAAVIKSVKELEYLKDAQGRVAVPGKVSGVIPNVKFQPSVDMKSLMNTALMNEGSKQLEKVIQKNPQVGTILNSILGGNGSTSTTPQQTNSTTDDAQTTQPTDKKEKSKAMINSVLNSIFK